MYRCRCYRGRGGSVGLSPLDKDGPENKLIRSGEKAVAALPAAVACGQCVPVLLTTSMSVLSLQAGSFINYLHPMLLWALLE